MRLFKPIVAALLLTTVPPCPLPHQNNPYVIQIKDGKALDKYGNCISPSSPEAHIPLNEFIYRD